MMNKTKKYTWRYFVPGDMRKGYRGRVFKIHKYATAYAKKIDSYVVAYIPHPMFDEV